MNVDTIADFLADQRDETPDELQYLIIQFENFWERKLWHQLTDSLIEFFANPKSEPQRLKFYKVFILNFADKINQLKLVDLGLKAATQCRDDQERLTFLSDLAKKADHEDSQDAFVYALAAVARVELNLRDLEASRRDLDKAERILDSFDSVETKVHAAFYQVNADYYQAKADFASYYRNALLYLACIDLSSLSPDERRARAYDLGIAALVSDSIYNFGELLQHPILAALTGEVAWLQELLLAFNRGDLAAYDVLSGHISSNPLLKEHLEDIRQKIYLAALTESVFRRPPHQRAMSFGTISADTKVRKNEIEHLVMKALSLGLVRGTIDEVDELVNFTWVQPRVLDMAQIASMSQRLGEWGENVNKLGNWIEATGQDIWAP
ncbi:putative 26S proteasome regulatory subunit rpn9 [Daldinia childiae]|uniref:putative 26S proteasome regulatory subunit rpn9 n=1 Tax=Daldinia childiae TaxID=326645 RepID=UPI001447C169|nr:putative 26S proteasome regulatory subunit rpn9 [Daldinia childiae]KAF3059511.1 putative 26S proteasome regulatory subunit rpn9 [Daldinia childiae]